MKQLMKDSLENKLIRPNVHELDAASLDIICLMAMLCN